MDDSLDFLNKLLVSGDTIILGCSGGPDSMALLYLLCKIRKHLDINIVVAHVNHNVRKESYDELLFVSDYCKKNKITFECMTIEKYSDDNFENEARMIRYDFFSSLIEKYNAKYLMTAHHGDDLIETILMRIVRGSTLSGYSGFDIVSSKDTYKIVRPLVYATKDEILDFDKKHNIPYVIDKTNFMDLHTRNRYRKIVLPFLKEEDKNVHLKFLKYSNLLKKYDSYIKSKVLEIYPLVVVDNNIIVSEFLKLEDLFQDEIIYKMFEEYYLDDLILINDTHVDLVKKLIYSKKANSCVNLPNNISVIKSYDKVYFSKEIGSLGTYNMEITDSVLLPNGKRIEKISSSDINNNYYCRLNSCDISLPLYVRTRKVGDKMVIKNMRGTKKINDIFIDMKIPTKDRDLWPIVVDSSGNIVWLPGLKKSKYDVPKTKKCDIILKYN